MKTVTIIVAIINEEQEQIRKCLSSIDSNCFEVIIVCPKKFHAKISETFNELVGFKIQNTDQFTIRGLWKQGEKTSTTPWMAFIQSSDILTAQLQKNIDQGCRKFTPRSDYKYDLQRISIFLKRRLKYCHFWTGEPIPHIRFKFLSPSKEYNTDTQSEFDWASPMGDLIHFGPGTISEAMSTIFFFIEEYSENIFQKFPNLDKKSTFVQAAKESLKCLLKGFFQKRWIRDGYEGFIFYFFDIVITCFGYLRYHEKYIRSGFQLSRKIQSIQSILLIHLNGIGDVFSTTPTIRNIKTYLPNASLDILIPSSAKGIVDNNPHVSRVLTLPSAQPSKKEVKKIANSLKPFKYDLIINISSRNSTEKLVKVLNGRWKINRNYYCRENFTDIMFGFKENDSSFFESEFSLLKTIGFEPKKCLPEIFFKDEEIKDAHRFLNKNGVDSKENLIILHPFSSDSLREWGIEKFIDLAKILHEVYKYKILLAGSRNEIDKIRSRIISQIPHCILYDGSVRKTIGIINESSLLVGGDSLFTAVSSALNIPTIVIQGPLWKPYLGSSWDNDLHLNRKKFFVFYKDLPCRDLLNTGCGSCVDQVCFNFSVDEVLQRVLKMMNSM